MGILGLIYSKWFPPSIPPQTSFKGQTILITGGTGGLGLETAIQFVRLGAAKVIITARNLSRGDIAKSKIEARTGIKDVVEVRELDMSSFENVKLFAEHVTAEIKDVDYVLLNAGTYRIRYEQSVDGWEQTLQVNALATTLLALLLLPWMKAVGSRFNKVLHLGLVSSSLHTEVKLEKLPKDNVLNYYNDEKHFLKGDQYGLSKLLLMYASNEMVKLAASHDGGAAVILNTMCPGGCKSDLARQHVEGSVIKTYILNFLMTILAKSTEAGSRTFVLAALTTPKEQGKYIRHYGNERDYIEMAKKNITGEDGQKMQADVWKDMVAALESAVPEVKEIISQSRENDF